MVAIGQPSTDSIHARWKTSGASDTRWTDNARPKESTSAHRRYRTRTKARPYSAARCRLRNLWKPGLLLRDDHLRRQVVEKRLAASVRGPAPPYGSEGRTLTSWLSPAGCCPSFSYTHRTPLRLAGSRKCSCAKIDFLQKIICMGNLAAPYKVAPHEGGQCSNFAMRTPPAHLNARRRVWAAAGGGW